MAPKDQQQEAIASLLELNGAQAQAAISEVDAVAKGLSQNFAEFNELVETLFDMNSNTTAGIDGKDRELERARKVTKRVMVQLQGFDRTAQRLSHLRDSLLVMSDYMKSDAKQGELAIMTRDFYSLAHEVELFELVKSGASRELLLDHALTPQRQTPESELGDELF